MLKHEDPGVPSAERNASIDVLRGLVIVLMALDHVRGFFTPSGANPTDLDTTTPLFFAMRWVTHLCAPTFVLLMGVSARLRHRTRPASTRHFLWSRGLWLIALELTVVSFCWTWNVRSHNLGVLWALGASMVLLVPFTFFRPSAAFTTGVLITIALGTVPLDRATPGVGIWLQPGSFEFLGARVGGAYAAVPWFAVAAIGWGAADWLTRARSRDVAFAGALLLAAGALLRGLGTGDPRAWTSHPDMTRTVLSVLHIEKYPPSAVYVLVFVGLALLLMAGPARTTHSVNRWLAMLGRVAMMFYLLHLPAAHVAGNIYAGLRYGESRIPADQPTSLWLVVIAWALLLLVLTPLCSAWGRLKQRRRDLKWLSYL